MWLWAYPLVSERSPSLMWSWSRDGAEDRGGKLRLGRHQLEGWTGEAVSRSRTAPASSGLQWSTEVEDLFPVLDPWSDSRWAAFTRSWGGQGGDQIYFGLKWWAVILVYVVGWTMGIVWRQWLRKQSLTAG